MKLKNNLSFDNLIKYYESMYKCSYDDFQVDELRIGYERGIDISQYTSVDYSSYQMEEIRLGLECNLDVSVYATTQFR